ncbi:hypothetical protein K438DRAFT_1885318 [Mycena galopus ATCC 62051]|nr:hypothetical protein K438DRAFT_1885318 [Mycena galopus ATCC 62051]
MVHVSITTPRSATLIFSWFALTAHYVPGEKLAQIQPASIMIFVCLTFNLLRSRSDVPGAFPSKSYCH